MLRAPCPAGAAFQARRPGRGHAAPFRREEGRETIRAKQAPVGDHLEEQRRDAAAYGPKAPEQRQSNPATHLPSLDRLGQTDRMMTEAEALKTLAREEPAVADDVRAALHSLTS